MLYWCKYEYGLSVFCLTTALVLLTHWSIFCGAVLSYHHCFHLLFFVLPSTQIYATQSTTDWEQNYSIIDLPIMPRETDRGISVGKGGPQGRERHWWLFTGQGCTGGAMCALCRTDPLLWHAHHLTHTTTCMHTFSLYINLIWWTRVKRYTVNINIGFKISLFIHFQGSLMGSLYLFMCRGTWVLY